MLFRSLSPCVDAAIRRAMAKEPRDRFRSMDELCTELSACLAELDGGNGTSTGAETMVVAPRWRRRQLRPARPPAGGPSVWPLIMLLAGLAILAGILAAVFTFTDSTQRIREAIGQKSTASSAPVALAGLTSYDPEGDNHAEHSEDAHLATDKQMSTYWTTERYNGGLQKSGVGLVLDASGVKKLSKLVVRSDTPGFTAQIQAGSSSSGGFTSVSASQIVGDRTVFSIRGDPAQYYVVWITDLGRNNVVHVNEVTARGGS